MQEQTQNLGGQEPDRAGLPNPVSNSGKYVDNGDETCNT